MKRFTKGLGLLFLLLTSCSGISQNSDDSSATSNEILSETSNGSSYSTLITEESSLIAGEVVPLTTLEPWLLTLEPSDVISVRKIREPSGVAPGTILLHRHTDDVTYITNVLNALKTQEVETYDSIDHVLFAPGTAHETLIFTTRDTAYRISNYGGYGFNGTKHYKVGMFLTLGNLKTYDTFTFIGTDLTDEVYDQDGEFVKKSGINYNTFEFTKSESMLIDGELDIKPSALVPPEPPALGPYVYVIVVAWNQRLYVYSPRLFGIITYVTNKLEMVLYDVISDESFAPLFPVEKLRLSDAPEYHDLPAVPDQIIFYSNVIETPLMDDFDIVEPRRYLINEAMYSLLMEAINDISLILVPRGAAIEPTIIDEGLYIYHGPKVWRIPFEYKLISEHLYIITNMAPVRTLLKSGIVAAPGTLKTLSDAYADGDLTAADIKNIKDYHIEEIDSDALPAAIEVLIKKTRVHELKMWGVYDAGVEDVEIIQYLGEHNGHYAVYMTDTHTEYTQMVWEDEVAGETFAYPNGNQIYLWIAAN